MMVAGGTRKALSPNWNVGLRLGEKDGIMEYWVSGYWDVELAGNNHNKKRIISFTNH